MLVPHAVSNLLLLCVPWSPTFGWAAAALWTRQALSKIDVPARQAFTAAVVTPAERTAAASLTTVARSIAVSASPLTSSAMLAGPMLACGAPFLLGGGLALAYDVTMWCSFRGIAAAAAARGRHRRRRNGVPHQRPISNDRRYRRPSTRRRWLSRTRSPSTRAMTPSPTFTPTDGWPPA